MDDTIRILGLLALGTRLKRLGERLQAETQVILAELDATIPAAQHPLLAALDRHGPLTIGELAQTLGVSQPAVTRVVNQLAGTAHLEVRAGAEDARHRVVSLGPSGAALVAAAKAGVWHRVEAAVTDLCDGFGPELLDRLATIEDRLAVRSLAARATEVSDGQA